MSDAFVLDTALRLTDAQYYGDPAASGGGVPPTRTIFGTTPIRINGGASGTLAADLTISIILSGGGTGAVGTGRTINTTAPLHGGGDLSADRTFFMDEFAGDGVPGYVPDPGVLVSPETFFLDATGAWNDNVAGVPPSRALTMGEGLLIDGVVSADLSADRTITMTLFTNLLQGGVPASGGGHVNVLFADGTWAPPGSSVGGFVTLQPTYPGTADTGYAHISARMIADLGFTNSSQETFLTGFYPAVIRGVQANILFPGLETAYYANNSVGAAASFKKARGTETVPLAGNDGDVLGETQVKNYSAGIGGYGGGTLWRVMQDGADSGSGSNFAQRWFGGNAIVGNRPDAWLTNIGFYIENLSPTKPAAAARLHVQGSFAQKIAVVSSSRALTIDDAVVIVDATASSRIITLETAVGCAGRMHTIVRGGSGIHTIDINTTSAQTISTYASWRLLIPGEAVTVQSDGSNWQVVSHFDWNYQGASIADGSTLANSTTDTTLSGNVIWNALGVGAIFGFKAFGKLSSKASSMGTLRLRVHEVGDFVIADSAAINLAPSLTDAMWQLECEWVRRDISSPSTLRAIKGVLTIDDGNVVAVYNNVASVYSMAMLTPHSSNFTSAGINTLQLFGQFSVADASNSITCIESATWSQPATANT